MEQFLPRLKELALRLVPRMNPIIIKEMRRHIRGPRAFAILTGYLLGLGLLAYGAYRLTLFISSTYYGGGGIPQSSLVGQTLFIGLALLEMLFVCFVTPALTAGTISGEYERQTVDMLLTTPLPPVAILWGKLVASLVYVQLLILAAIPLSSIIFLFGGVAVRDAVQAIGLMILTAITYGMMGVFFSALTRRTGLATVLSYAVVVVLLLSSILTWTVSNAIGSQSIPRAILYLNPISALSSAIVNPAAGFDVYSLGPAGNLLMLLGGGPDLLGIYSWSGVPLGRPVWQYTAALYVAATIVFYLLTTQLVKPLRRWRMDWRTLVVGLLVVALLVAGLWVVFGSSVGSTGWIGQPMPTEPPIPMAMPVVIEVASDSAELVAPAPTPLPTPPPFDPAEQRTSMCDYLAANLLPAGETSFCDLEILSSQDNYGSAEVQAWAYCRAFRIVNNSLQAGLGASMPVNVQLYWSPDLDWQVSGYWTGGLGNVFSAEVQQQVLDNPYDDVAGEERLLDQARQALLGE